MVVIAVVAFLLALAVNAGSCLYAWAVVTSCRADDALGTWASCLSDLAWSKPVNYVVFALVTLAAACTAQLGAARLVRHERRFRTASRRLLLLSAPAWFLLPASVRMEPLAVVGFCAQVLSWVLLCVAVVVARRSTA